MRSIKIFAVAAILIAAVLGATAFIKARPVKKSSNDTKGFAVIELFTSEGCSSCPPADDLVAKIQKEVKDKPVYILAYHVDYWNRLGWKDAFSSADFSKRQYDYAAYLHLRSVYTPQIVVNGRTEFVGSDEGALRSTISNNLQKTSASGLSLNAIAFDQKQAAIKYTAAGINKNMVLQVAILQKNAQTKVERGENSGRTLSHVQIVRKLQSVPLNGGEGTIKISLPQGFDTRDWEIIGFLQNKRDGTISGASRVTLSSTGTASAALIKN